MRRALVLAVAIFAALALAGPGSALTRKQAVAAALKVLHPERAKSRVVVFGLPSAVGARSSVARIGLRSLEVLKPRGRAAWLFWEDLHYEALFEHPSRIALVDDRTGKVRIVETLWYPLIDGRDPPFLRTTAAYRSARYKVWSSLRRRSAGIGGALGPLLAQDALPKDAFKDDCLIVAGALTDGDFPGTFSKVKAWARSHGMTNRITEAMQHTDGKQLGKDVAKLIKDKKCKDVLLWISGHGGEPGDDPKKGKTKEPTVFTVKPPKGKTITAADLAELVKANAPVTFKIVIDSCYSGRFVPALSGLPNLLALHVSSAANEVSYMAISGAPKPRAVSIGKIHEFTNGVLAGLEDFAASKAEVAAAGAAGGSLLARALDRAVELGKDSDAARANGLTHPPRHPDVQKIAAKFGGDFTTTYTLTASDPNGDKLTVDWSARIGCGTFKKGAATTDATGVTTATAGWRHPHEDQGGDCKDEQPHPGVITATVMDGLWTCTLAYMRGSADGTSDPATCAPAKP